MRRLSDKKLRKYLIDVDKTKNQLREEAGISASTMSRLKKGDNVNTAALIKICDYLGCEISDICELEHVKKEDGQR